MASTGSFSRLYPGSVSVSNKLICAVWQALNDCFARSRTGSIFSTGNDCGNLDPFFAIIIGQIQRLHRGSISIYYGLTFKDDAFVVCGFLICRFDLFIQIKFDAIQRVTILVDLLIPVWKVYTTPASLLSLFFGFVGLPSASTSVLLE